MRSEIPDHAWAERVAARLRGEFGVLVASFDPAHQRATAMARWLDLQVPLCHRVVTGVRDGGAAASVFGTFPGIEGLRIFLRAVRSAGSDAALLERAEGAVAEFEALIARWGGSQRRLVALLGTEGEGVGAGEAPERRRGAQGVEDAGRRGFEALVDQIGCVCDTLVAVRVYTPSRSPKVPNDLDVTAAIGRVGFRRTSAAMPFVVSHQRSGALAPSANAAPGAWSLMEEFCTLPLPSVVLERRGEQQIGIVDPSFELSGPMNVFAGPFSGKNVVVREGTGSYLNAATSCSSPAEWLITDVYVPRAWAADLAVSAGAYRAGLLGEVTGPVSRRWFDRLPMALTPGLLGRGLGGCALDRFPRHAEFTTRVFAGAGADPSNYTGFRLAVHYPMLAMQYLLSLELQTPEAGGASELAPA